MEQRPAPSLPPTMPSAVATPVRPTMAWNLSLCLALWCVACSAPIHCPPGHIARYETQCPASEEGQPYPSMPCSKAWVCRETRAWQRRQQPVDAADSPPAPTRQASAQPQPAVASVVAAAEVTESRAPTATALPDTSRPYRLARGVPAPCATPCPLGGVRVVVQMCQPKLAPSEMHTARCPSPVTDDIDCAVPWQMSTHCEPPPPPPRPTPRCRAHKGQCCLETGEIVVPCGAGPARSGCRGGLCGSGGPCSPCR